ncbi:ABC transporter permease [Kitasatospora sp. NPDC048545]|uniref:ABC transporter permease n=1 Tax=Kitasatospora sp. NPDC048545 TaxID=3157208 RepID=UPI0033D3E5C6
MTAVLAIALKDLRQRLRDRSAWVIVFLAPLLITGLMSLAFSGSATFHAKLAVVDLDHGAAAAGLLDTLRSPQLAGTVTVHPYPDGAAAAEALRHGTQQAAIVVPAGFTAALTGGAPEPVTVLDSVDYPLQARVADAVSGSYVAQVNADRLSVATALAAGSVPQDLPRLAAKASALQLPEQVRADGLPGTALKAVSYFAPSMGMFFVLFTVGFAARGYFAEQRQGTLDRIAAAPVGRGALLLGKSLSTFAYSLAGLATTLVAARFVFGADYADPLGVAALCVAMAVAVVCLTALVIAVARTERQAEQLSSVVVFVLVLLGGNFVFASAGPPILRRLALFTPNGWALRGFTDLGTGVHGLTAVGPPLLGIAACSGAAAAATVLLVRRRRTP